MVAHAAASASASLPPPAEKRANDVSKAAWTLAVVMAAWTMIAMLGLIKMTLASLVAHRFEVPNIPATLQCSWMWALFTLVIFRLAERFPITRRTWSTALAVHALGMLLFAAVDVLVDDFCARWVDPLSTQSLAERFTYELFINCLSYLSVLAVGHALRFQRISHQRALEAARLQGELVTARLSALEMRLRPHFLYNTLHSIAALVRVRRGPEAVSMIAGLGDLLRAVLATDGSVEVTLQRELELLEQYLAIERIRFGDRLRVSIHVDPTALDALVPTLLLQPIVENAVRHGIEADPRASTITLDVRRDGSSVELCVADDGRSEEIPRELDTIRTGVGLDTTRRRLQQMYGDAGVVVFRRAGDGLPTRTLLRLPFHATPAERAS